MWGTGSWYGLDMSSRDAQWIIGVIAVAVIALGTQMAGSHRRIDDVGRHVDGLGVGVSGLRNEVDALRTDVDDVLDRLNVRLRAVEVAFGKVDQRLATIERVVLPAPDGD